MRNHRIIGAFGVLLIAACGSAETKLQEELAKKRAQESATSPSDSSKSIGSLTIRNEPSCTGPACGRDEKPEKTNLCINTDSIEVERRDEAMDMPASGVLPLCPPKPSVLPLGEPFNPMHHDGPIIQRGGLQMTL